MQLTSAEKQNTKSEGEGSPSGHCNESKKPEESEDDPRDKGWAWVIALAIAVYNVLLGGTAKANGVLYLEWIELYGQSPSTTAWVRSAFSLTQTAVSPLSGYLRDRMSFQSTRVIIVIGVIIWALGLCLAGWMPNIEGVIICYSLFGGAASGIIVTLIFSLIPIYFVERKSLASGIALAGGSIGGLTFPILVASLAEIYGIRGTVTIIGGVYLNGILVASVMIPLRKPKTEITKVNSAPREEIEGNCAQLGGDNYYVNEAFDNSEEDVNVRSTSKAESSPKLEETIETSGIQTLENSSSEMCVTNCTETSCDACESGVDSDSSTCQDKDIDGELQNSSETEEKNSENSSDSPTIQSDSVSYEHGCNLEASSNMNRSIYLKTKILNLRVIKGATTYIKFLRTPHLFPLTLIFLCASFGYYTQFFVLVPLATELGASKVMASTVISILSVAELFGRLVTGYIADRLGRKKLWILPISFLTSFTIGILVVIFPLKNLLYAYAAIFGIFGGMYLPLTISMTTDLVPVSHFGKASGLLPMVIGIGSAAGNQLSTVVYEASGSYKYSLLLCVMMYMGALFFFGVYALGIHRRRNGDKIPATTLDV